MPEFCVFLKGGGSMLIEASSLDEAKRIAVKDGHAMTDANPPAIDFNSWWNSGGTGQRESPRGVRRHLAEIVWNAALAAANRDIAALKAEVERAKAELQAVTWKPQPGEDKAFGIARLTVTAIKAIRDRDAARAALAAVRRVANDHMAHWPTCHSGNDFTAAGWAKCTCHMIKLRVALAQATPPG